MSNTKGTSQPDHDHANGSTTALASLLALQPAVLDAGDECARCNAPTLGAGETTLTYTNVMNLPDVAGTATIAADYQTMSGKCTFQAVFASLPFLLICFRDPLRVSSSVEATFNVTLDGDTFGTTEVGAALQVGPSAARASRLAHSMG